MKRIIFVTLTLAAFVVILCLTGCKTVPPSSYLNADQGSYAQNISQNGEDADPAANVGSPSDETSVVDPVSDDKEDFVDDSAFSAQKRSRTGVAYGDTPEHSFSYVGTLYRAGYWSKDPFPYPALNQDLLGNTRTRHYPIYRFSDRASLVEFCDGTICTYYIRDNGDRVPMDCTLISRVKNEYDEEFFAEHTLLLTYFVTPNVSDSYSVRSVRYNGNTLIVGIQKSTSIVSCFTAGAYIAVVELPTSALETYTRFDAIAVSETTATWVNTSPEPDGFICYSTVVSALYVGCQPFEGVPYCKGNDSSSAHALYRLQNREQVDDLLARVDQNLKHDYGGSPYTLSSARQEWEEALDIYDEEFFADRTLFLRYVVAGSGGNRYSVGCVGYQNGVLTVNVKLTSAGLTCDMAAWLVLVEAPKAAVEDCTDWFVYSTSSVPAISEEIGKAWDGSLTRNYHNKARMVYSPNEEIHYSFDHVKAVVFGEAAHAIYNGKSFDWGIDYESVTYENYDPAGYIEVCFVLPECTQTKAVEALSRLELFDFVTYASIRSFAFIPQNTIPLPTDVGG